MATWCVVEGSWLVKTGIVEVVARESLSSVLVLPVVLDEGYVF